jgi:ADP-ribosyltransferase exoenzyme
MIDQLSDDFVAAYANWLGVTEGEAYQLLKEEPLEDVTDELTAAGWEEREHPRHPEGTEEGGRFAPKLESAGELSAAQYEALKGYREGLRRASDMGFLDQTYLSGHFMNVVLRGQMFDEEAARYLYEQVWHEPMNPNAPVYKKEFPRAQEQVATTRKHIKLLDEAIAESKLAEDYVVYRGMTYPGDIFKARKAFVDDPVSFEGRKFTDRGFTATTYDPEVARNGFGKGTFGPGWVARWTVKKGTPALLVKENGLKSGIKKFASESELLLGRGHTFFVKKVDPETRTIDLEMTK